MRSRDVRDTTAGLWFIVATATSLGQMYEMSRTCTSAP